MKAVPIIFDGKEVDAIEYRKGANQEEKSLMLTWIINNICTNACSYCPKEVHNGTNHNYGWEHTEKFVNECFDRYGTIHVNVSGGEPTVSPFFKQLVNLVYDRGGSMHLTTNLVRPMHYWEDISSKFDSISASYHPEFLIDESDNNVFIEKANYIGQRSNLTIRVMMLPSMWDRCYAFYEKAVRENKGYAVELVKILPNFGVGEDYCEINYSPEQLKVLDTTVIKYVYPRIYDNRRHTDDSFLMYNNRTQETRLSLEIATNIQNTGSANFLGWECDIGLESLFVHYNGMIQRGNCAVGGELGNICDFDNINWPKSSITCNKTLCHCMADLMISKRVPS